jgi:hypothetical protein
MVGLLTSGLAATVATAGRDSGPTTISYCCGVGGQHVLRHVAGFDAR